MNEHQQKTAEQIALIATLVMDINNRSDEFFVCLNISGHVNNVIIYAYEKENIESRSQIWALEGYFDQYSDSDPFFRCLNISQIIVVLRQIRLALIHGRTQEKQIESFKHTPATDFGYFATTRLDERTGTYGAFFTEPARLRNGSVKKNGRQPTSTVLPAL